MRTEALFFKTLLLVFVTFYFTAMIIWMAFFIVSLSDFSDVKTVLGVVFGLSLIASLFFSPVLLLVSFVQWWAKSKKLKNIASFISIIIYGHIIFAWSTCDHKGLCLMIAQDKIINYLVFSIPSTLLFMTLLMCITKYLQKHKTVKASQKLDGKNRTSSKA